MWRCPTFNFHCVNECCLFGEILFHSQFFRSRSGKDSTLTQCLLNAASSTHAQYSPSIGPRFRVCCQWADAHGTGCNRVLFSSLARGDGSRLLTISKMFSNASAKMFNNALGNIWNVSATLQLTFKMLNDAAKRFINTMTSGWHFDQRFSQWLQSMTEMLNNASVKNWNDSQR